MRYVYLSLVTVLVSNICVDSAQASRVGPTKDDDIFLGCDLPVSQAAPQETPQGAGTARTDSFPDGMAPDRATSNVSTSASAAVGSRVSDSDALSLLSSVFEHSSAFGSNRSAFSRPGESRFVSKEDLASLARRQDPRILAIGLDDEELPEDLAGKRTDTRLLAFKDANSDDEAFELSSPEEERKPLPVAQVKALVAGAMAQRGE